MPLASQRPSFLWLPTYMAKLIHGTLCIPLSLTATWPRLFVSGVLGAPFGVPLERQLSERMKAPT